MDQAGWGVQPASIQNGIKLWALKWGPGATKPLVPEDEKAARKNEVEGILTQALRFWGDSDKDRRYYYAFWLMANLGLRLGEVLALKAQHVQPYLGMNTVYIPTLKQYKRKKGTPQALMPPKPPKLKEMYVSNQEVAALLDMLRKIPRRPTDGRLFTFSLRSVEYRIEYFRRLAGIQRKYVTCHSLRHFCARRLEAYILGNSKKDQILMCRMRHTMVSPVYKYIVPPKKEQLEALNRVPIIWGRTTRVRR